LPQYLHGAGQEGGRRASTENVILIVAMGKACELAKRDLEKNQQHLLAMRERLHEAISLELKRRRPDSPVESLMRLNGPRELRLPNTLSLSFRGATRCCRRSAIKSLLLPAPPATATRCSSRTCLPPWASAKSGVWAP